MTSRVSFLIAAAAVSALAVASLPAWAAMPVGATQAGANGDMTLVQAQVPGAPAAATTDTPPAKASRSKKSKRQREVDSSVQSGTVPKRYMNNVPKQYHDLIPWAK